MKRLLWTLLFPLAIPWGDAIAQTDGRPEFEVASIRPSAPDAHSRLIFPTPGGRLQTARGAEPMGCLAGVGLFRGIQKYLLALIFSSSNLASCQQREELRIMPTPIGQQRAELRAGRHAGEPRLETFGMTGGVGTMAIMPLA